MGMSPERARLALKRRKYSGGPTKRAKKRKRTVTISAPRNSRPLIEEPTPKDTSLVAQVRRAFPDYGYLYGRGLDFEERQMVEKVSLTARWSGVAPLARMAGVSPGTTRKLLKSALEKRQKPYAVE